MTHHHRRRRRNSRFTRRQKNLIHFALIILIMVCLTLEVKAWADWGFVALAVICEVS